MQSVTISDFLKSKFVGTDDLRRELTSILNKLPKENKIVITQHGKPKAVILDLNIYLELTDIQEDVIRPGYIDSLYSELEKVKRGKGAKHEELVKKLKL